MGCFNHGPWGLPARRYLDWNLRQHKNKVCGALWSHHGEPWQRGLTPELSPCPQFLLSMFADSLLMLTLPLTAVRLEGCFVESVVEVNRCIFFFCWLNVIWLLPSLPSPWWKVCFSILCLMLILLFFLGYIEGSFSFTFKGLCLSC